MAPLGVSMRGETLRGEGRPLEMQRAVVGPVKGSNRTWGQAAWQWLEQDTHPSDEGRTGQVTPTLGVLYISKFYAFNLRQFAICKHT